jgi:hypothetical protein
LRARQASSDVREPGQWTEGEHEFLRVVAYDGVAVAAHDLRAFHPAAQGA